jgi:lipid II isoglutaminyl synthase (glutamine-hydrolysing)
MVFGATVAAARAVAAVSRRTRAGGGTTLPGKLLLRVAPGAISRLAASLPDGSCVISATNGKTTTAKMATGMLEPETPLCSNRAGANLASGIASALIECTGARMGLFEVDEGALPAVSAALRPRVLVLGNLFRDQLDRWGELESVAQRWAGVVRDLPDSTTLVTNADDPLVAWLGAARPGGLRFGVDDPSVALASLPHAADSKWCPRCGAALEYRAVYLGHLGDHRCPACGLSRPPLDVAARDVRLRGVDETSFTLRTPAGEAPVTLAIPGLFNVYNALAAAALAHAAGVPLGRIREGLEGFAAAFGRFERVEVAGRSAVMLLVKNPAGANEIVRTLTSQDGRKTLMIALNDRIADGRDVSWIWDVDWEPLLGQAGQLVLTGTRAAEMAVRSLYGGAPRERIVVEPDLGRALDRTLAETPAGERAYLLSTYTAMLELRSLLGERGAVAPYWRAAA